VIRILDHVVVDWEFYVWEYDGELVDQVKVYLSNGMVLVMDYEEFMVMSNDEGY
jgi:hypothetical protein